MAARSILGRHDSVCMKMLDASRSCLSFMRSAPKSFGMMGIQGIHARGNHANSGTEKTFFTNIRMHAAKFTI